VCPAFPLGSLVGPFRAGWSGRCWGWRPAGRRVSGDVKLSNARTSGGEVVLRGARIQGSVVGFDAKLRNEGGIALNLHLAHVGGDVRLGTGFSAIGEVDLDLAVVEGGLNCCNGMFNRHPTESPTASTIKPETEPSPNEATFSARSATFRGGVVLFWDIAGPIDFTDATSSSLTDRPMEDWHSGARIAGFTYERLAEQDYMPLGTTWAITERIHWLEQVAPNDPGPWEYAARVLRADGYRGTDQILINHRRMERKQHGFVRKLWDSMFDFVARYGYKPVRASGFLLYLIVIVSALLLLNQNLMRTSDESGVVYSPSGPIAGQSQTLASPESLKGSCGGGQVRCFEPIVYAVDTVVPIIDLNQRTTWYVTQTFEGRRLGYVLNICTVFGWIFSTLFVFSLAKRPEGGS